MVSFHLNYVGEDKSLILESNKVQDDSIVYDRLINLWQSLKPINVESIEKIEIIENNTVVYVIKGTIHSIVYNIDFKDERVGESLTFNYLD
jgi:hypothetical protein